MLKKIIVAIIVLFVIVFIINAIYYATHIKNVALIKLNGIITPAKANNIVKQIKTAKQEANIKAVLFEIDSPGGEACSSQRIYLALKELSNKKPVVALIKTVGASGAYFAACGASKIVAYPASTVGSIGVIFETLNFSQLAKKMGVSLFVVKTGPVKDVGNPFRKPTEQDKEMIENLIDSIYNQFINAVSSSRHIPIETLKKIANGSVFTGNQALKLKLVDSTKGETAAKDFIKKLAHIKKIKIENLSNDTTIKSKILGALYLLSFLDILSHPTTKAIYQ